MDENSLPKEYTEEYCTSTHRVYRKWVLYDPESMYNQYALVEENITPLEEETSFREEEAKVLYGNDWHHYV